MKMSDTRPFFDKETKEFKIKQTLIQFHRYADYVGSFVSGADMFDSCGPECQEIINCIRNMNDRVLNNYSVIISKLKENEDE